jgi:hypothetical protein
VTDEQIESELKRIIGALCYEVKREIADDVYLRVRELIRQSRENGAAPLKEIVNIFEDDNPDDDGTMKRMYAVALRATGFAVAVRGGIVVNEGRA